VICVILASGGRFASFFGRAHDGCKPPQHASNMIGMSMRLERLRFSFIEEKMSLSPAARAFSDPLDTGWSKKMRSNKEIERMP
jgi:hypothetical protein